MAASLYAVTFDTEDPDAGNTMVNNVNQYYEVRLYYSVSLFLSRNNETNILSSLAT